MQQNANEKFGNALNESYKEYVDNDCANHTDAGSENLDRSPCIVAWISTPGQFDAGNIAYFMKQHSNGGINDGWMAETKSDRGWSNKVGWIATKAGASFEIGFPNIKKEVRTFTLYYLRSYGDKWEDLTRN